VLGLALQLSASCVSVQRPSFMQPEPKREWPEVLALAQLRAHQGNFDSADSMLAAFGARYPATPQGVETAYWRALIGMDPANPHASLPTAVGFLDAYLAGPHRATHEEEATSLRRVAVQLEETSKLAALAQTRDVAAVPKPQPPDVRVDAPKPATDPTLNPDAEIKRLKDELAKANAELERIRKRLAQPPPGKA
jgi:hypothetical protein